jgi:hypothetical protein
MNDLRILFFDQPPFFQAVAVVLAALGLILLISVGHEVLRLLVPWYVHWSARRYLDKVVRFERIGGVGS